MRRLLQGILMVALVGFTTACFAASECSVCNAAGSDNYGTKTAGQLGRGLANTCLGCVELGAQPVKEVKEHGPGGLPYGIAKGIGYTCLRMAQGVGEIVTCPFPRAKDGKYTQIAHDCPLGVVGVTDR